MRMAYHNRKTGDRLQILVSDRNILDALAYAVEADIPPANALEAVQADSQNSLWRNFLYWGSWDRAIQMLRDGCPVSAVLKERRMPYYLYNAVAHAEKNGRLPAVLPLLARNLHMQRFFAGSSISLIFRNLALWLMMFAIITFLFAFIYPNLQRTFFDLIEEDKFLYIGNSGLRWDDLRYFAWLPILLAVFLILFIFAMNVYALEGLYLRLPYFGGLVKRRILYDLSGMFYCLLAGGMDIGAAARAAAASEPRFWLRNRLEKFARAVESGEDWLTAWRRHIRLSTPMADWILHSGHASGNLAAGFNDLQNILCEENLGSNYRLNVCLSILIIFINALVIGFFAFSFFYLLTNMIMGL